MGRRTLSGLSGPWREFSLIAALQRRFASAGPGDCLGLGDDAAAYRPRRGRLELVTCDALVENIHWKSRWCGPRALGIRAAAVNLSDIAAMGGEPERGFLILALPRASTQAFAWEIAAGVASELRRFRARLAGGDTVASAGPVMVALALQGTVPGRQLLTRSGARPGDRILVTGFLGDAAAGRRVLDAPARAWPGKKYLRGRFLRPQPRIRAARVLAQSGWVSAMLDLSDGLAGDLRRLAQASGVGARVEGGRLPISAPARVLAQRLRVPAEDLALRGGEDYELLFTAPARRIRELQSLLARRARIRATEVGEILPLAAGLCLRTADGRRRPWPQGWEHHGA